MVASGNYSKSLSGTEIKKAYIFFCEEYIVELFKICLCDDTRWDIFLAISGLLDGFDFENENINNQMKKRYIHYAEIARDNNPTIANADWKNDDKRIIDNLSKNEQKSRQIITENIEKLAQKYGGYLNLAEKTLSVLKEEYPEGLPLNKSKRQSKYISKAPDNITKNEKQKHYDINDTSEEINNALKSMGNTRSAHQLFYTPCPESTDYFEGRKVELEKINQYFNDDLDNNINTVDTLFLTGISGIGKSELAKRYAKECVRKKRFDNIIYRTYEGSLCEMVRKSVKINGVGHTWQNQLSALQTLCNTDETDEYRTLFIIDNYNIASDDLSTDSEENECWDMLCQIRCKRLITSTYVWERYVSIPVERLGIGYELEIFKNYSEQKEEYSDEEIKEINEIINEFDGHTLAVKLTANWLRLSKMKSNVQISQILQTIKEFGLPELAFLNKSDNICTENKTDKTERIVTEFVKKLLDKIREQANELTMQFLYCAALLPISGIQKELSDRLFLDFDSETIYYAKEWDWIKFEKTGTNIIVKMHPLISQVILAEADKIPEQHEKIFMNFMKRLLDYITELAYNPKTINSDNIILEQLIKIVNRIVKYNIRCYYGAEICSNLFMLSQQLIGIYPRQKEYDFYEISLHYGFPSPYCPEVETIYYFEWAKYFAKINLDYNADDLQNIDEKIILSTIIDRWFYPTARGFCLGQERFNAFLKSLALCNHDLHIAPHEIQCLDSIYNQTTYSSLIEEIDEEFQHNKKHWFEYYMVSPLDGERKHISDGILSAAWYWKLGFVICTDSSPKDDLLMSIKYFKKALCILRKSGEQKFLPDLELNILNSLSASYFKNHRFKKCCKINSEIIFQLSQKDPQDYRALAGAYFNLGLCQLATINIRANGSLLKAYDYIKKINTTNYENEMGGETPDVIRFKVCQILCYIYKMIHHQKLALLYFNEAVSLPIRTLPASCFFGILWENANQPIRILLDNWEHWFEQMNNIDPERAKEVYMEMYPFLEFIKKINRKSKTSRT